MFDFFQNDNSISFEITGTAINSCEYSRRIRDDLRLLLSQNVAVESAVKQILEYYQTTIKYLLTDYEYLYYLPQTYLSVAYFLAKNGYYHETTFNKALDIINNETTLFVWEDAIKFEKIGYDAFNDLLFDSFGKRASSIAEVLTGQSIVLSAKQSGNVPKIITQILLLDGSAKKKLEKRRKELLKVKEILLSPILKPKKPSVSSILGKISDYKFSTDLCEGDVLAYKIKNGKYRDKYAVFVVDYIREKRKILCDFSRLVEKREYLALYDGIFDDIPTVVTNKFLSVGVKTDFENNNYYYLNHFSFDCPATDFDFIKLYKTQPPTLQKSAYVDNFFSVQEEPLDRDLTPSTTDEILTNIFDQV